MRFVALDVGDVRIGVAVCDPGETAAFPLTTLRRSGRLKPDVAAAAAVVAAEEAEAVVVGWPLSLDGEVGPQARKTQGFARALARAVTVPVRLWDESLSSVEAEDLMIAQGLSRARRRERIDQAAAALILDSFLSFRRQSGTAHDRLGPEQGDRP